MTQLVFDDRLARQLETLYRTRDVLRRRRLVREAVAGSAGKRILDVGCGPGFYVAELLVEVGPTGWVVGVDASPQTLALARRRTNGADNVQLYQADATDLPVPDASFDAALSVQVLEYVGEVDAALAELRRALRPGGRLVIWDVDWSTVSWHSADPARMRRVLRAWDGHLADPCLPRTLAPRLRAAGFADRPRRRPQLRQHRVHPRRLRGGHRAPGPGVRGRPRRRQRRRGRHLGHRAGRAGGAGRVLLRLHPVLLHRHPGRLGSGPPRLWETAHNPCRARLPSRQGPTNGRCGSGTPVVTPVIGYSPAGAAGTVGACATCRWLIPAPRICARRPASCCGSPAGSLACSRSESCTGWPGWAPWRWCRRWSGGPSTWAWPRATGPGCCAGPA